MCKEGRCGRHPADCPDTECPTHASKKTKDLLTAPAVLFVYGTLRPNEGPTTLIPGYLYDLGWYPGIELCDPSKTSSRVTCEIVEVKSWERLDAYEGYDPDRPDDSLYIRREVVSEDGIKGFIYEYNQGFAGRKIIESGDWFTHKGVNGNAYSRPAIAA